MPDLLRRVGRLEQVAGIEAFTYADGAEEGVRAVRVRTGTGLSFTVLPDRGMDIGPAEFQGMALAWSSPTGVVAPWYREVEGEGWLRSFHGGLLATCGLDNVGPAGEGDVGRVGLHGRASNLPASNVTRESRWDTDGCKLVVTGQVRDAAVFGHNLVLRRQIVAHAGASRVRIEDSVENQGWSPAPLMLLYHLNLGWPLLDHTARLSGPGATAAAPEPRDADAAEGLETWERFGTPTPGFRERVYHHRPVAGVDGWAEARLENPSLAGGTFLMVRFRPDELPEFAQWTMTGEGMYVLGLEPATCRPNGFQAEADAGRVVYLTPGARRRFRLEIAVGAMQEASNYYRKDDR
jgi:hypothetical protein